MTLVVFKVADSLMLQNTMQVMTAAYLPGLSRVIRIVIGPFYGCVAKNIGSHWGVL